ncbi:NAD(P)-dependent oxidoreductase [Flavobacterium suaedae]|uniref:NAD(P)-dependent oxidoreductase n=1 Tax=Flavobacterium suaedae TaxID=1767027 RepID=A0ABQ1K3B4_9FLAO|nr:SDR family oxidoreductase [Flavobacterium suaedae]GGB82625.1 NAD(P)-dependent oxidoreductase [Flavobacterium suaedae]
MKKKDKILITGATGYYGYAVVESLIENGVNESLIYAMARDDTKVEKLKSLNVNIVFGDYNHYGSMLKAFSGIDKLLFVSSNELENRSMQHIQVVNAAVESNVKYILYTSQDHKKVNFSLIESVLNSHLATENAIKESGLNYTILRNGLYMDILPLFLGDKIFLHGIYLPAGNGKIGLALRSEMAETAAKVLISNGHKNKIYSVCENSYSFSEIAEYISRITGKNITYLSPSLDTFLKTVIDQGMPKACAKVIGGFASATRHGELDSDSLQMAKLLGRKPVSVEQYLEEIFYWKYLRNVV